jgi:hypothetical protein
VKGWEAFTLLGLLKRANFNCWTTYVSIIASVHAPEIRLWQQGKTGKFLIKIVEMHMKTHRKGNGK